MPLAWLTLTIPSTTSLTASTSGKTTMSSASITSLMAVPAARKVELVVHEVADHQVADRDHAPALAEPVAEADEIELLHRVVDEGQDVRPPVARADRPLVETDEGPPDQRLVETAPRVAPARLLRPPRQVHPEGKLGHEGQQAGDRADEDHHDHTGNAAGEGDRPRHVDLRAPRRVAAQNLERGDEVDRAVDGEEEHRDHRRHRVEVAEEDGCRRRSPSRPPFPAAAPVNRPSVATRTSGRCRPGPAPAECAARPESIQPRTRRSPTTGPEAPATDRGPRSATTPSGRRADRRGPLPTRAEWESRDRRENRSRPLRSTRAGSTCPDRADLRRARAPPSPR